MASIDDLFEPSKSFSHEQMELLIAPPDFESGLHARDSPVEGDSAATLGVETGVSEAAGGQVPEAFIWDEFASGSGPVSGRSVSLEVPRETAAQQGPADPEDLRSAGLRGQYTWLWWVLGAALMGAAAALAWWVTQPPPPPVPPAPRVIEAPAVVPLPEDVREAVEEVEPAPEPETETKRRRKPKQR